MFSFKSQKIKNTQTTSVNNEVFRIHHFLLMAEKMLNFLFSWPKAYKRYSYICFRKYRYLHQVGSKHCNSNKPQLLLRHTELSLFCK